MDHSLPAGSSLLMALIGSETDITAWMQGHPERVELMRQALYQALPYAFDDDEVAGLVGHLLAAAVQGTPAQTIDPHGAAVTALRRELLEKLQEKYKRFRELGKETR